MPAAYTGAAWLIVVGVSPWGVEPADVVNVCGGSLPVESVPGKGHRVTVTGSLRSEPMGGRSDVPRGQARVSGSPVAVWLTLPARGGRVGLSRVLGVSCGQVGNYRRQKAMEALFEVLCA